MSQPEVIFKFGTDASGMLQAVNQLTGEVMKLGRAEDEVKKKIEAAKQATLERLAIAKELKTFNDSVAAHEAGPVKSHVDRVRDSAQDRIAKAAEVRAAGLNSDGTTRRERLEQEITARHEARYQQSMMTRAALQGRLGVAEQLGAVGSLARGAVGAAAAPFAALAAAGHMAQGSESLDATPFMFESERRRRSFDHIIGIGWLERQRLALADASSGRGEKMRGVEERAFYEDALSSRSMERTKFGRESDTEVFGRAFGSLAGAQQRAANPVDLPRVDLSTAAGQRQRQEDLFALPVRLQNEAAKAEMAAAKQRGDHAASQVREESKLHAARLSDIREKHDELAKLKAHREAMAASGELNNGPLPKEIEVNKDIVRLNKEKTEAESRRIAAIELQKQASKDYATAQDRANATEGAFGARAGGHEFQRSRIAMLSEREQRFSNRDVMLGMAGPEQRFMAEQYRQMAKQIPYEMLPAEIKQGHAAFFPEEAHEMAGRAGGRIAGSSFGRGSREYEGSTAGTRDEIDALQRDTERMANENARKMSEDVFKFLKAYGDILQKSFGEMLRGRDQTGDVQKALEQQQK
jgi:hypothetical protein